MIPVPRIYKADQLSSGSWLVWFYEEKDIPQWDSARRCFILDDLRARLVSQ